jgi:SAM-dependent methyltransferase
MQLWQVDLRSLDAFRDWAQRESASLAFRRSLQKKLETELREGAEGVYLGFCAVCGVHQHFTYDHKYSDGQTINWRERLVCRGCQLNNRLRLAWQVTETLVDVRREPVYLTEHLTPFAELMRKRSARVECSEFLGEGCKPGSMNRAGVRHEDLTRLSFQDHSFKAVLSFDVFEHIPDYRAALKEVARVISPGGVFLMTVPLHLGSGPTIVRAEIDSAGRLHHLLPPEYHGDPVDPEKGILCFYHFGWQVLDEMKSAGFHDAMIRLLWSSDYANVGNEQAVVIGTK